MRRLVLIFLLIYSSAAAVAGSSSTVAEYRPGPAAWPEITAQSRPWTRWWWLGSAVDEAEITRQLLALKEAGFGGVEISPIYGAKGAEDRYLQYLSPEWVQMLRHTVREGHRLGLGVDMIQGTGWPFGGPWVPPGDAAQRITVTAVALPADGKPAVLPARAGTPLCVMAYPESGAPIDLTKQVQGNRINWEPPAGTWKVYALLTRPTGQKVKRAGPGGDGLVLDPFGRGASQRYFEHFIPVLTAIPAAERPRALFNDSFEAFGANWTPDLLAEFQQRRGYDLRQHLPSLSLESQSDDDQRVRADYRLTVSELLLEDFTKPWSTSARGLGVKTRNQAHGSPGNVLDLYAAADIPETEMFGPARRGTNAKSGWKDLMVCKLASSAAHVTGKPLCSSESMTWLGEHFQVSLAEMKEQADTLFLAGVNHLFYHGTPYSPAKAEWPGWLFYAATEVTPANTWWRDLPALNRYIARCQSFLQTGRPDNEVLLYFPMHDLFARDAGSSDLLQYIRVHNTETWLDGNPEFAGAAKQLWEQGYGFDFVSDKQLNDAVKPVNGALKGKGGDYRLLLVAGSKRMPPETLARIVELAKGGATVAFLGALPNDVPGYSQMSSRRERLAGTLSLIGLRQPKNRGVVRIALGKGQLLVGDELAELLRQSKLQPDPIGAKGLAFLRRKSGSGSVYFVTNRTEKPISITRSRRSVLSEPLLTVFEPSTGKTADSLGAWPWVGPTRHNQSQEIRIMPGESCILRSRVPSVDDLKGLNPRRAEPHELPLGTLGANALSSTPMELSGRWKVEFIAGGETLPKSADVIQLSSWTTWGEDPGLREFSGTARYKINFPAPERKPSGWVLDLGTVFNSAHVQLNGKSLGTLIAPPYRIAIPSALIREQNALDVEVTNLMANRIAGMDRRKEPWQRFYFVNIDYKPFDASKWEPRPSGLLGPVRLIPLNAR